MAKSDLTLYPATGVLWGLLLLGCLRYVYRNIRAKDHCCGVRVGL